MDPAACRRAALSAFVCAALNALAAVAMLLFLRPGLPPVPIDERQAYLIEHAVVWRASWCAWIVTVLSLACFYFYLHQALDARTIGRIAVLVGVAGLAPDITAEIRYMTLEFDDVDQAMLTGCLGNGAYTVAWALLTGVAARRPEFPRRLVALAVPGIVAGFGLAVAGAVYSPTWLVVTTAICIPIFTLWTALVGLFFWKKSRPADTMSRP